jgi:hypothetical protein
MKTSKSIVDKELLTNIVQEKIADKSEIVGVDLKMHTKLLAEESLIPFYSFGVGYMNIYCHIHDSYSEEEYKKILLK